MSASQPYRQIRADYDENSIVVYQAYRPEIVARLREQRSAGDSAQVAEQLPQERPYPLPEALKARLRADV
jgi:hypothetical protein